MKNGSSMYNPIEHQNSPEISRQEQEAPFSDFLIDDIEAEITAPPEEYGPYAANEEAEILRGGSLDSEVEYESSNELAASSEKFAAYLEGLGTHVEEVARKAPQIKQGAEKLIARFKVRPEFFTDDKRSAIFMSLALKEESIQQAIALGKDERHKLLHEQNFVTNAALLLTQEYAEGFPHQVAKHKAEAGDDAWDVIKAKMNEFEQPELSRSLDNYIKSKGLLDDLKDKIGVDGGEPSYHVLSFGQNAHLYFGDVSNGVTSAELNEWSAGLEARAAAFEQAISGGGLVANATGFAVELPEDHRHHVYIPAVSAEVLMAEERGIDLSEAAINYKKDQIIGTIRHEYVHTQGDLTVGGEFGKCLEERRAEYYSGETREYFEVKAFFRHLQVIKGKFIGAIFDEALQNRDDPSLPDTYELLAKYYGIEAVAEIAAAQPDVYIKHTVSTFTKGMLDSLGGCNAIIERMIGRLNEEELTDVRARTVRVINNFRREKVTDGGLDPNQEQFLSSYFAPVLSGLGLHLKDITFAS